MCIGLYRPAALRQTRTMSGDPGKLSRHPLPISGWRSIRTRFEDTPMTRRAKLLITAALIAGLGAAAIPTLAAQTGSAGAGAQAPFQTADSGDRDGGRWHHHG